MLCFGMLSGIRTCCLRIHFCDGIGLLIFGYKEMANVEGQTMSGNQKQTCCRRMFNGLKCLVIWILIPVYLQIEISWHGCMNYSQAGVWNPYCLQYKLFAARVDNSIVFLLFRSGMSPWGYRGLSWFHCTWHETLYMRHMIKVRCNCL